MKTLPEYGPIPTWYELSNREGGKSIGLKVHRLAFEKSLVGAPWQTAPVIQHAREIYGLSDFTPPREGDCGFGDVLKLTKPSSPDWVEWTFALPVLKTSPVAEKSPDQYCVALRVTLSLFLQNCLWLFEDNTGWHTNQLMIVDSICLPDKENWQCSGSLSMTLTPDAIKWLAKQPHEKHLESVVDAMKIAHEHIWHNSVHGQYRFGALCRQPKWINLDLPGDACGLDPDHNGDKSLDRGYTLTPHNVDNALQQFTFLAGLAKLHDMMRGS